MPARLLLKDLLLEGRHRIGPPVVGHSAKTPHAGTISAHEDGPRFCCERHDAPGDELLTVEDVGLRDGF